MLLWDTLKYCRFLKSPMSSGSSLSWFEDRFNRLMARSLVKPAGSDVRELTDRSRSFSNFNFSIVFGSYSMESVHMHKVILMSDSKWVRLHIFARQYSCIKLSPNLNFRQNHNYKHDLLFRIRYQYIVQQGSVNNYELDFWKWLTAAFLMQEDCWISMQCEFIWIYSLYKHWIGTDIIY